MMNDKPPSGVSGPTIFEICSIPRSCRVASTYKEPLNKNMPATKNQPDKYKALEGKNFDKIKTHNNAAM